MHAGAEGQVRVGVAVDVERVRRRRRPPGRGWRRRAARRSSGPARRSTSPTSTSARWRCARTAAARSRSAASPPRRSAPASGAGPQPAARSIATRPLPNTLTDASWPALSSSTADATTSSSVSPRRRPGRDQVGDQVVARARAALGEPARGRSPANSLGGAHRVVDAPAAAARRLVHPHDGLRPGAQLVARRRRARRAARRSPARAAARRSPPITSKPAGSTSASSSRAELAHPRPQPLDVAAGERRRRPAAAAGCAPAARSPSSGCGAAG